MTRRMFHIVWAVLALTSAAGAFFLATRQVRCGSCLGGQISPDRALAGQVAQQRRALALALTDPNVGCEALLARARDLIRTSNRLVRRVTQEVLAERLQETPTRSKAFLGTCRQAMCPGPRPGRQGCGMCAGGGCARGCRCSRLGHALGLDSNQVVAVETLDPNFSLESEALGASVREAHSRLQVLLCDLTSTDESVLTQLDRYLQARALLEERTIGHVARIRGVLTQRQVLELVGLCCPGHEPRP